MSAMTMTIAVLGLAVSVVHVAWDIRRRVPRVRIGRPERSYEPPFWPSWRVDVRVLGEAPVVVREHGLIGPNGEHFTALAGGRRLELVDTSQMDSDVYDTTRYKPFTLNAGEYESFSWAEKLLHQEMVNRGLPANDKWRLYLALASGRTVRSRPFRLSDAREDAVDADKLSAWMGQALPERHRAAASTR